MSKVSRVFEHCEEESEVGAVLEWPIARGLTGEEQLLVQILTHNRWDPQTEETTIIMDKMRAAEMKYNFCFPCGMYVGNCYFSPGVVSGF